MFFNVDQGIKSGILIDRLLSKARNKKILTKTKSGYKHKLHFNYRDNKDYTSTILALQEPIPC